MEVSKPTSVNVMFWCCMGLSVVYLVVYWRYFKAKKLKKKLEANLGSSKDDLEKIDKKLEKLTPHLYGLPVLIGACFFGSCIFKYFIRRALSQEAVNFPVLNGAQNTGFDFSLVHFLLLVIIVLLMYIGYKAMFPRGMKTEGLKEDFDLLPSLLLLIGALIVFIGILFVLIKFISYVF